MAWLDPIRIVVIILLTRDSIETTLRHSDQFRGDRPGQAVGRRQRVSYRREDSIARQADGHLLVPRQAQSCAGIGNSANYEAAVIPPVEPDPRPLPELILQMCRLVIPFVMIDAENACAGPRCNAKPGDLRLEEPCRHARHHYQSAESMIVRHASAQCKARDLRVVPFHRERYRSIPQDARSEEHTSE